MIHIDKINYKCNFMSEMLCFMVEIESSLIIDSYNKFGAKDRSLLKQFRNECLVRELVLNHYIFSVSSETYKEFINLCSTHFHRGSWGISTLQGNRLFFSGHKFRSPYIDFSRHELELRKFVNDLKMRGIIGDFYDL